MKSLTTLSLFLCPALTLLVPAAPAEVLYDKEGIQLQGTARIVSRNAAICNVLEEKYSPEEYEKLKANQGQPLHLWRLDYSAHNNTGKALDYLSAHFNIESPHPPCTNWSKEGPGSPSGDVTDDEGNFAHPAWGDRLLTLPKPFGLGVGEVDRDTDFLLVFHVDRPVFTKWNVHFTFARTKAQDPGAATPRGQRPPRKAATPRIQLPPDILADKYLRQAEQLVREKDSEGARKAMQELIALQQAHGLKAAPEDHFRYAQIWSAAGAPEQAMEAAVRYLQIRGREADHYEDAIDLINRAEARQARGESGAGSPAGRPGTSGIRVGETVVFDGMEFVGIPPGEFLMGSARRWRVESEGPATRVRITEGFYLGKYEVTQNQWQAVMGNNPSHFAGCGNCPVEQVSWEDVQVFIGRLNAGSGGGRYRLPTEAEWEYAARAGTTTDTYAGDYAPRTDTDDPVVARIAWCENEAGSRTHSVGRKPPNGFGLHDIMGNVKEWVGDLYGLLPGGAVTDPSGPVSGYIITNQGGESASARVLRGCGWNNRCRGCNSSNRRYSAAADRSKDVGFRLLREE